MEIVGYVIGQKEARGYYSITAPLRTMTLEEAEICIRSKRIEYPSLKGWVILPVGIPVAASEDAQVGK